MRNKIKRIKKTQSRFNFKLIFVISVIALFCISSTAIAFYVGDINQFGYQAPMAAFYSLDAPSKGFSWTSGLADPTLGTAGVFTHQDKHFQFDYENVLTNRQDQQPNNWMDIVGHMSIFKKDHRIDLEMMYGIPDEYVKEEIVGGKPLTTIVSLQLWVYKFTVTITGVPDGQEKVSHQPRSWEPANVVSGLNIGIGLGYTPGIVESNANETYLLYLLSSTSKYTTNDGDEINSDVGSFKTYGKQEADAILTPAGTGIVLVLHSQEDGGGVGPSSENDMDTFISGIPWLSADALDNYQDVWFEIGITKFQCGFFYTWSVDGSWYSVGPQETLQPQAELTFDVHVLVIGKSIFELPYSEIADYNVDIDLHEEVENPDWLGNLLLWVGIGFIAVLVVIVLTSFLKRSKTNITVVTTPQAAAVPQEHKREKKKTKWRIK